MKLRLKENTVSRCKIFFVLTAAAFVFVLAGCIHYGSGNDRIGHFGAILELTGQPVYIEDRRSIIIAYEPFEYDLEVFFDGNIIGEIAYGELSFSIARPDNLADGNWGWLERELVTVVPAETQHTRLILYTDEGKLFRGREIVVPSEGFRSVDRIEFIYVDRTVNLLADSDEFQDEVDDFLYTFRGNSINLLLRAGWNAVHINIRTAWSDDYKTILHNVVSLGEPASLRWILENLED